MRIAWTVANVLMGLAFASSVAVQYNDPDPLPWMAVYGAAAAVCGFELWRRVRVVFPGLVAAVSLAWAASIAPRVVGTIRFSEMFGAFEMQSAGIEEAREMCGLLLVAIWMALVAVAAWRRQPVTPPGT